MTCLVVIHYTIGEGPAGPRIWVALPGAPHENARAFAPVPM